MVDGLALDARASWSASSLLALFFGAEEFWLLADGHNLGEVKEDEGAWPHMKLTAEVT